MSDSGTSQQADEAAGSAGGSPPRGRDLRTALMQPDGWRLERRLEVRPTYELYATVIALAITAVLIGLLVLLVGVSPFDAFSSLYEGAFGDRESALETLVQSTPLILTGLAAAVAFRAGVWNIGGQGQFIAGAIGTFFVYDMFPGLPAPLLIVAMLVGAAVFGAIWATVASVLLVRYNTNEILTTVMLNFVIDYFLSWLLSGVWQASNTPYSQTERMAENTYLPRFFDDSRLHWGFAIALIAAAFVHFMMRRTSMGFEFRAIGVNKRAASYKGINTAVSIVAVMAVSGALAGLAGAGELLGLHHRINFEFGEQQIGFTGIIIALVARLHPVGVIAVAIAFAGLVNGATQMQISTGIPAALVTVIEGVALVLVLVAAVACRYRLRRGAVHADESAEGSE